MSLLIHNFINVSYLVTYEVLTVMSIKMRPYIVRLVPNFGISYPVRHVRRI